MGFKFFLNVLYNIGIIICLIVVYYSLKNSNWAYLAGSLFLAVMILIFKLRLIKDIRNMTKKP